MNYLFTTNRLQVRKLKLEDLGILHQMHSNPNVMRFTGDNPKTLEEDRVDLMHIIQCYTKTGNTFWVWGVERTHDQQLIGTCALLQTEDDIPEDEIGYRFLENEWGKGYASEIAKGLIQYVFEKFDKEYLVAEVDELNVASVNILEKLMLFEKTYYNPKYQSYDRKYRVMKKDFIRNNS